MNEKRTAARLRELRRKALWLNETFSVDLHPFHEGNGVFRRLPTSAKPEGGDINASTSCTALMALCSNDGFDRFFNVKAKPKELPVRRHELTIKVLQRIVESDWRSSRLKDNNAFTTTLVLRTAGFLAN